MKLPQPKQYIIKSTADAVRYYREGLGMSAAEIQAQLLRTRLILAAAQTYKELIGRCRT